MAHQSYAGSVLKKALELAAGNGEATVSDISAAMNTQTRRQHKRVMNILSEHARDGRLRRIRQGVYGPLSAADQQPDKREVMWRLLKMRRRVTLNDLVELAGVSREYAREWLAILVKREVVRKTQQAANLPAVWQLINDTAEMPVNTEKAEKYRELRRKKRAAIDARLDEIDAALTDVRGLLQTLEEEE